MSDTVNSKALAERLSALLTNSKGKTQASLARYCGVSTAAVAQWVKTGYITEKNLERAASFLNVDYYWLKTGQTVRTVKLEEEPVPDGYSAIPAYELIVGANNDYEAEPTWEEVPSTKPVILPDELFQKYQVLPSQCKQVTVSGNSMEPFLFDGDSVVFYEFPDPRPGSTPIVDGKIYVIGINGAWRIKRLSRIRRGFLVMSDNPTYQPEEYTGDDCDQLRIYGRVIYVSRDSL